MPKCINTLSLQFTSVNYHILQKKMRTCAVSRKSNQSKKKCAPSKLIRKTLSAINSALSPIIMAKQSEIAKKHSGKRKAKKMSEHEKELEGCCIHYACAGDPSAYSGKSKCCELSNSDARALKKRLIDEIIELATSENLDDKVQKDEAKYLQCDCERELNDPDYVPSSDSSTDSSGSCDSSESESDEESDGEDDDDDLVGFIVPDSSEDDDDSSDDDDDSSEDDDSSDDDEDETDTQPGAETGTEKVAEDKAEGDAEAEAESEAEETTGDTEGYADENEESAPGQSSLGEVVSGSTMSGWNVNVYVGNAPLSHGKTD